MQATGRDGATKKGQVEKGTSGVSGMVVGRVVVMVAHQRTVCTIAATGGDGDGEILAALGRRFASLQLCWRWWWEEWW